MITNVIAFIHPPKNKFTSFSFLNQILLSIIILMKGEVLFLYLGIFSYIIQIILVREFINLFYGNEFFIAITLFLWLFSTGLGSFLYQKLKEKIKIDFDIYFYLDIYFVLLIILNRFFVGFIKKPGEGIDIFFSFILMFFEIFPLCFLIGYIFPFFAEKYNYKFSHFYMTENIGFIVGGFLFYFFLTKKGFSISASFLFLLSGLLLFYKKRFLSIISFILFLVFLISDKNFEKMSLKSIFKNEDIIFNSYTPKGKLTITKRFDQFNFYYNNFLLSSDKEAFKNELKIHLPFLFSKKLEKILYIGTPFSGILNEIYKYKPQKLVYLDIDEYSVSYITEFLSDDLKENVYKSFIKMEIDEFINKCDYKFDVIILDIPSPSSLEINRFYSFEFFKKLKKITNENSIVVNFFKYSSGYLTQEVKKENIILYKTLKSVFDDVIFFPDEENIFISFNKKLNKPFDFYLEKFKDLKIDFKALSYNYLEYRFKNDKIDEFKSFIKTEKNSNINSFLKPEIYVYNILNQIRIFYPSFSNFYLYLMNNKFVFGISFLFVLLGSIYFFKNKFERIFLKISALSFLVISLEIISIYLFEINFGRPVEGTAIIITLVMSGIAFGSSLKNKNDSIYNMILPLSIICIFGYFLFLKFSYKILLFLLTFFIGFILGVSFNIFSKKIPPQKGNLLYAFDLLGSVFGVLFTSVFFIPLFGIKTTLWIIIFLLFLIWLI